MHIDGIRVGLVEHLPGAGQEGPARARQIAGFPGIRPQIKQLLRGEIFLNTPAESGARRARGGAAHVFVATVDDERLGAVPPDHHAHAAFVAPRRGERRAGAAAGVPGHPQQAHQRGHRFRQRRGGVGEHGRGQEFPPHGEKRADLFFLHPPPRPLGPHPPPPIRTGPPRGESAPGHPPQREHGGQGTPREPGAVEQAAHVMIGVVLGGRGPPGPPPAGRAGIPTEGERPKPRRGEPTRAEVAEVSQRHMAGATALPPFHVQKRRPRRPGARSRPGAAGE
jgi:hypothetical protein